MNKYQGQQRQNSLRIVITDLHMFEIQKEIDLTNFTSLSDNIDATLSSQCF